MNMLKTCNSAAFVNYVKPEVVMIEMEIEGSLLLTASVVDVESTSSQANASNARKSIKQNASRR
jgi:hypothetical protein